VVDLSSYNYIFYDLETTGQNPCFDQPVRFAAIETDSNLQPVNSYNIDIKLRNDILPHPKALLVNRLSISDLNSGLFEYEAFQEIHKIMNKSNTISIGYNSLNFDDIFLRFGFYRNLFEPYSHHNPLKGNNFRADLYNIIFMYYLYKQEESIIWPIINNRLSLKLEQINSINHLYEGMSHDAEVDVQVTIKLAQKLKSIDDKMWNYLVLNFVKNYDRNQFNKLTSIKCINDHDYKIGLFIGSKIGLKSNYCAPIIYLSEPTKNKIMLLRLDHYNFEDFNQNEFAKEIKKGVISKKFGEPNFIIPFTDQYTRVLDQYVVSLAKSNLSWIKHHPESFESLIELHRKNEYEKKEFLDLDASLYEESFFKTDEINMIENIHNKDISNKMNYINNLGSGRIKELGTRIMGRNYFDNLSGEGIHDYNDYLKDIFYNEPKYVDFRGGLRSNPSNLLRETKELLTTRYDLKDQKILNSLKDLILEKTCRQQDLGF